MKNIWFFLMVLLFFLCVSTVYGQEGFTGPRINSTPNRTNNIVTVAEARILPDDTRVTLQGYILNSLGRNRYTFRDNTGEITIEIERKVWRGLSVNENDHVEIYGEVDIERNRVEIEVKRIRKL